MIDKGEVVEHHLSKELLDLLEKGLTSEAAGVYGGSVELVNTIALTRTIPSLPENKATLSYQTELLKTGKKFYYFLPFLERIQIHKPGLKNEYVGLFKSEELAVNNMSIKNQVLIARAYAGEMAIKDCFYSQTGMQVDTSEIFALAEEIDPNSLEAYEAESSVRRHKGIDINAEIEWVDDFNPKRVMEIRDKIGDEASVRAVRECLLRRGILLYFGPKICNYQIVLGKEMEVEGIIFAPSLLTLEVISGMETLAMTDRKALRI